MEDRFLFFGGEFGDELLDAVGAADLVAGAVGVAFVEVAALQAARALPAIDDFSAHMVGW